MLVETEIEAKIVAAISAKVASLGAVVVGARQVAASGYVKGETDETTHALVVVALGFRANDAFSLSPISIDGSIAITTTIETDPTGETNESCLEGVANLLQLWHDQPKESELVLSTDRFTFGELRLSGGSGKQFNDTRSAWVESIQFTIRGALTKGN